MKIAIVKETAAGETRCAAIPYQIAPDQPTRFIEHQASTGPGAPASDNPSRAKPQIALRAANTTDRVSETL